MAMSVSRYAANYKKNTFQNQSRSVTQIQYTNWPDHGVPKAAHEILYLFYKVKQQQQQQNQGPLLVHCSAGVGRTGTYIALSNILQHSVKGVVDVLRSVAELREQRVQMVQTVVQYRFVRALV